jgi:tetratricopeptide (TPR) repeat protein
MNPPSAAVRETLGRLAFAAAVALLSGAVVAGAIASLRSEGRLPALAVDRGAFLRTLAGTRDRARLIREWKLVSLLPEQSKELAHSRLGRLYLLEERWDEAAAHLRRALRFRPDSATVRVDLAHALAGREEYDEAILELRRALELDPSLEVARTNLAVLLEHQRSLAGSP